ncbi:hypothetical protein [Paenibacillus sp. CMAA1364]
MEIRRVQKLENIFNNVTSSKQVHEGVLFVENTSGDFSYSSGYGGKELDSPLLIFAYGEHYEAVHHHLHSRFTRTGQVVT